MSATLILWPVIIQIALTLAMFILLGVRKAKAVKSGQIDRKKAALHNDAWPDEVLKVSNNIQNQFQTPILFYVLSIAFLSTNAVSVSVLTLAWVYALSRVVHAYVHVGSNYVPNRFKVFLVGVVTLMIMMIILAKQTF